MAKDWTVTSTKLETVINPEGTGFAHQYNVKYKVTGGPARNTVGEIHVDPENYESEHVAQAISAIVARHQDVHSL
jgi:hypothetical protein